MIYPKFLKEKDSIGITALSSDACDAIKEIKISLNHLRNDYHLIVTPNVYGNYHGHVPRKVRVAELNELLKEDISMLMAICGGDYLFEILDDIDYEQIVSKRLLVEGYSDITTLLYILTTKYDLATFYGLNAKSFYNEVLEEYQLNNLKIIRGNLTVQKSFMDRTTISLNGNFESKGIIIGGCLDSLRYIFGTNYDMTKDFLDKYKEEKIIWYFDIYSMSSIDFYLTLLQMKKMGYFVYSDTFIFGTVLFPNIASNLEYKDALQMVFENCNIVFDANIGHVKPVFTIINGSIATVSYQKNSLTLKMELLDENNG